MSGFDLIHTYSSDALAQWILKSFFAFTNVLMPLPRSEPVAPNRPRLSGKHGMHSPNSLTICYVCMYVCVYVCLCMPTRVSPPLCEHCQCILTVRHILVECNHFARERKDIFGRRDVVESFRFHPTLIVLFLKQIEFYYKF